jgi:hypothetical protein
MIMTSNVVKFPYSASRRVHSKKPRASKNGSPEERAAKAAASQGPAADIVGLSTCHQVSGPMVDRRKVRGSPLREKVAPISFAATIVGKMHTADLREEVLNAEVIVDEDWVSCLQDGAASARFAACEFDKAAARLERLGKSETSDNPVNLPVPDLGPTVLNLTAAKGDDGLTILDFFRAFREKLVRSLR